jgi:hypothetical protein
VTPPTIKLFQFPRMLGVPNVSPFCCKLETWLRIAQLPYEVVETRDPRKGPKGKLPFTARELRRSPSEYQGRPLDRDDSAP